MEEHQDKPTVVTAIQALGKEKWKIEGPLPVNETEFLDRFWISTGVDETDTNILSNNPDDFGITWAQVSEKLTELLAVWHTTDYYRDRAAAYPTIGDQLDMLWHAIDTGDWTAAKVKTTEFYTALKTVKDANSKP
jgi:hypothetical protein